jgi:hypothetical protein
MKFRREGKMVGGSLVGSARGEARRDERGNCRHSSLLLQLAGHNSPSQMYEMARGEIQNKHGPEKALDKAGVATMQHNMGMKSAECSQFG